VNIYPAETEAVLLEHPAVLDAAVFGIPNDDWGEEVKAVIEPADGHQAGDQYEADLRAWAEENLAPQGAEIRTFPAAPAMFQDLAAGGVTAVVNDEPATAEIIADLPDVEIVEAIDTDEKYGFAYSPENPELREALNGVLAEIIADGTYQQIFQQYFPGVEVPPEFQPA
jgi:ABC-type amino acid transport substrate-binding protein